MSSEDTEKELLETMTAIQLSDKVTSQGELYCVNCCEFLWPPIMLGKKGNICGNCWKNDSKGFIPNIALEKTLENLSIRCMNSENGCKVRNHYKEMAVHKKQCTYRSFSCPINSIDHCEWLGYNNDLVHHFIQEHPQNIIKAEINSVLLNVDVENDVKEIKLMMLSDRIFISLISNDIVNQILSVTVFFVDDFKSKANDYQFIVQLSTSENALISHETNKFEVVHISNYNKDYNDGLKIDIGLLKRFSTDSFCKCTFKILSNVCESKTSEELLRNFECPVCNNYMRAPIYQCLSGHSICKQCKPKLMDCPICHSDLGNTRNYSLESFSNGIYFPCSYYHRGCEQSFLEKDINKHEGDCRFRSYICPFGNTYCDWIGLLTNLSCHLKNVHTDATYMTNQEKSTAPFWVERHFCQTYCLMTYGEIFRVSYEQENGHQNWAVQLVGPKSETKVYSYEITLINERKPHKKLTRLDLCQEYTGNDDIFNHSVKLPSNILSEFTNNGELTYLVRILKIRI
ncbi:uncharacterized protein LOC108740355 isoform X2 [Agrilus planipennis]|uniref:RING-type E3 ubiquitin transferase n=1 Tax=Agrilus planipennis TaxID=224129 RepID=A0A1W4XCK0_AGRPL|nr:uncharacterized protein LOC108740355 isoform X2 [Agrilus planipennis]